MAENIVSVIGNTPLVSLNKLFKERPNRVFAKVEAFNPGGSIKDRPALSILRQGLRTGRLHAKSVVIASSSGNMGIGLAQACAYFDLHLICVVDPKVTMQNLRLLEAYGAEVDMVLDPDEGGEYLKPRLARVQELLRKHKNSFWPNQYSNLYAAKAHFITMREIVLALNRQVDYLFCSASTCGTLRGCVEYIRSRKLKTKVIAIDAVGSILFGGKPAKRLLPGHGASVIPKLYKPNLADEVMMMSDLDCVIGCRRLVREEGILAGGSSGAVLMAFDRMSSEIPLDMNCALIFPDRGERYLDTIYSDEWVKEHFGDVAHHWEKIVEVEEEAEVVEVGAKAKAKAMAKAKVKAMARAKVAAKIAAKISAEAAGVAAQVAANAAEVAAQVAADAAEIAAQVAAKAAAVAAAVAADVTMEATEATETTDAAEVEKAAGVEKVDEEECMTVM